MGGNIKVGLKEIDVDCSHLAKDSRAVVSTLMSLTFRNKGIIS